MKIMDFIGYDYSSNEVVVRFINRPRDDTSRALMEAASVLVEGHVKKWGDGYTYRLDRRPDYQGGDQIHIFNKNKAWAYRHTGQRVSQASTRFKPRTR